MGRTGLALVVGLAVLVATPMSVSAADRPRPAELWRAYPLRPNADAAGAATHRGSGPDRQATFGTVPSDQGSDTTLQLGVWLALMGVAFLAGWFWPIEREVLLRADVGQLRRRLTGSAPSAGPPASPTTDRWTCEIGWQGGVPMSRFQAVIASPDGSARRLVAESAGVPWPPVDGRTLPRRELEDALGSLVASLEAAGWEPIASGGSWTSPRFVWPHGSAPPTTVELQISEDRAPRR